MSEKEIIVKLKVIIISLIVRICLSVKRVCDVTRISCTPGQNIVCMRKHFAYSDLQKCYLLQAH